MDIQQITTDICKRVNGRLLNHEIFVTPDAQYIVIHELPAESISLFIEWLKKHEVKVLFTMTQSAMIGELVPRQEMLHRLLKNSTSLTPDIQYVTHDFDLVRFDSDLKIKEVCQLKTGVL